jgi:hypothetical protein
MTCIMGNKEKISTSVFLYVTYFILIFMGIHCLTPKTIWAITEKAPQLFLEANQAYENGDYKTAATLYESVLDEDIRSGMIYYNLGNCYVKLGETGKALLNYRHAQLLLPRDGDLKFNLQYVLDQRKDRIETRDRLPIAKAFFFWYFWLSLKELSFIFLMANLIFWCVSLILLYKNHHTLRWIRTLSLCLLLIFGISLGTKVYRQNFIRQGVVITSEATVRSGNGPNHSTLFVLHEGAEFRVDEETKGWMKIRLGDGKIGWVSSSAVEVI